MLRTILLTCVFIGQSLLTFADGNEALFHAANEQYAAGRYSEAIESYTQILQTGQESAAVYYNLGNSFFKTNQISDAILNYERGLLLTPGDEDILYNLSIANEMITDKIDTLPEFFLLTWVKALLNAFPANIWALISLLVFIMSAVLSLAFILSGSRKMKNALLVLVLSTLMISALSLVLSIQSGRRLTERNTAIVFAPSVTIKSSPDQSGTDLFILHEGIKVQITDRLSNWYEIKLADGNVGWIPADAVETI